MNIKLLLIAVFLMPLCLWAQSTAGSGLKWGNPTQQEFDMTSCDYDPDAGAVVLGKTTDVNYVITKDVIQVQYDVKGRVKILNSEGAARHSSLDIVYKYNDGKEGNRELVNNIKATTYNLVNGSVEKSRLREEMINTRAASGPGMRAETLLFPDVKPGSIIEYEYTILSDLYLEVKDWEAQCEMPVLYTRYDVSIPEWFGFFVQTIGNEYNRSRISQQRTNIHPTYVIKTAGSEYECVGVNFEFVGRNLTALKDDESLIFSPRAYAQRVIIDITNEALPRHSKNQYSMTWDEIDQCLLGQSNFGKLLKSNPLKKEMKKAGIYQMEDDDKKIAATVKLLRENVKWNGVYGVYGTPASKVLKSGTGSNSDINFILIAMLNDAGIKAYPAILSSRDCDVLDNNHPTMENVTSTIAVIDRGSRFQVFDGSVENAVIDILPTKFLVNNARVVKKDNAAPWINLEDRGVVKAIHKITGNVDASGKLTATCVSTYDEKGAELMRQAIKNRGDECPNEKFQSSQFIITDYRAQGVDDVEKPVTEIINFGSQLTCSDNTISVPQLMVPLIDQSLFASETRYNPVEFPTKEDETIEISLSVPEGWTVADVPAPMSLNTSDGKITMSVTPSSTATTVMTKAQLAINRLVFAKKDYSGIKNLVDRISKHCKEPFVIKKQ